MEVEHPENGPSPFAVYEDADLDQYVECSVEGCGEMLRLFEIDYHEELHEAEAAGNRASSLLTASGRQSDEDVGSLPGLDALGENEPTAAGSPVSAGALLSNTHETTVERRQKAPSSETKSRSRRESRRKTVAAGSFSPSSSSARPATSQQGLVQSLMQRFSGSQREPEVPAAPGGPPELRRLGVCSHSGAGVDGLHY